MPKATSERDLMTNERRSAIVEEVSQAGSVRVGRLAERFGVSAVTIRSDLAALEKENRLVRDHGGALPASSGRTITSLLAVETRTRLQEDEKQRIARAAAAMVRPGETIFLDAGTTAVQMVPFLKGMLPLTIVTNAVNVALAAASELDAEVILLGGVFNRESSSNIGAMAERALGDFLVDRLFLGTQAADIEHGLTDTTLGIAQIKRAMIRASREVVLLADSTKWNSTGSIKVAPLSSLHRIISDAGLPVRLQKKVTSLGVQLSLV